MRTMGKLDGFLITEWRRLSEYKASPARGISEGFQIILARRIVRHPVWGFVNSLGALSSDHYGHAANYYHD